MNQQPYPKPRGGAPIGNQFALVHGHYSRAAIAERKRAREAKNAERAKAQVLRCGGSSQREQGDRA